MACNIKSAKYLSSFSVADAAIKNGRILAELALVAMASSAGDLPSIFLLFSTLLFDQQLFLEF